MKQYEGYCPGATYENVYCKSKYVNKNIERVNCFLPVGSTTGWANFVLFPIFECNKLLLNQLGPRSLILIQKV